MKRISNNECGIKKWIPAFAGMTCQTNVGFSPEFLKLRMSADPAPILFFKFGVWTISELPLSAVVPEERRRKLYAKDGFSLSCGDLEFVSTLYAKRYSSS